MFAAKHVDCVAKKNIHTDYFRKTKQQELSTYNIMKDRDVSPSYIEHPYYGIRLKGSL